MSIFKGLGRALQLGAGTYINLRDRSRDLARQDKHDAIQALLSDEQIANAKAGRASAERAEQRSIKADQRERAKDLLENLPGPTSVDDATAKALRESGFGVFLDEERAPVPGLFGGMPMGPEVATGRTMAKPLVPPSLKAANEATERAIATAAATNARAADSLEQRERFHIDTVARDKEMLDIRRQLAEIQGGRTNAIDDTRFGNLRRAFEALIEEEAQQVYPVSQIERITGVFDANKAQQREAFKARRLSEFGFTGPVMNAPTLVPSHGAPTATPSAEQKAAEAAARVRGRR